VLALLAIAVAGELSLPMAGAVPDDGLDHFFLPFEVPEGIAEIEVRHEGGPEGNILDWGLDGPDGFVGWGGGNAEPAIVNVNAASRSYLPTGMTPGTWQVVVGKAKIVDPPGEYAVEVILRDTPTLAPQPERTPYVPAEPLRTGPGWFAGDLHVHSRESGDANPSIDEIAAFADSIGLDFVVFSDHNTVSQNDFLVDAQARFPELLLLPGIEFTTYAGHAGATGATRWVDHRIGQPGATIEAAAAAIHEQDALLVVNHPTLNLGTACTGCAWEHDLDPDEIDAVEVITGGWSPVGQLFFANTVGLWESWLDAGARVAAVGGSDDHTGGAAPGSTDSPLGSPTTLVWAESLSADAILAGLRAGLTVVKLQGPDDPMVELWPDQGDPTLDDTPDSVSWTATITGGEGGTLQWIVDGGVAASVAIDRDLQRETRSFDAGPAGLRVRVALIVDGAERVVTSYRWVEDDGPAAESEPCGCATGGGAGAALAGAAAVASGRRRTPPPPRLRAGPSSQCGRGRRSAVPGGCCRCRRRTSPRWCRRRGRRAP
jgi:hypothetical protein